MVMSPQKLQEAVDVLRSFGAHRVLLFGSYAYAPEKANDIDLAVEGIPLGRLMESFGAVGDVLDVPFDLVHREELPDFFNIVKGYAKALFDDTKTSS